MDPENRGRFLIYYIILYYVLLMFLLYSYYILFYTILYYYILYYTPVSQNSCIFTMLLSDCGSTEIGWRCKYSVTPAPA
jgi:hypothetical protein